MEFRVDSSMPIDGPAQSDSEDIMDVDGNSSTSSVDDKQLKRKRSTATENLDKMEEVAEDDAESKGKGDAEDESLMRFTPGQLRHPR